MLKSNTLNIFNSNDLCYITFPIFEKTGMVRTVFTTKLGGVSQGFYASMNMGLSNGDNEESVKENYNIICNAVGINPENLVLSHQTHTDNIRIVTKLDKGKGIFKPRDYENVDGLITNESRIALVTQFADCTPLLLLDPVKHVIANLHSGWRGTVQQIGAKGVEQMVNVFGCNPKNILAAIGPSICKKCYEVDMPVYSEFSKIDYLDIKKIFTDKGGGKFMLDLWEANRQILLHAGLRPENIEVGDLCTHCHSDVFHSHRATGAQRGNLAAIIELV